jgi:DNA invertase Pin-like site-specific DNA recombinase
MTGLIAKEMLVAALCERRCEGDAFRRFIRSTVDGCLILPLFGDTVWAVKTKSNPPESPSIVKDAFSYIRFSSKKQADGASLERQLAGTRKYCEENRLVLNESLTFRDLGVSAFKGDNRERGLGELLQACEDGLIPRGSALVVEALDRLSRQRPRVVSTLLGRLLDDYGLEVHLTGIKKVLYPVSESAADEGMDLLYVTMLAIRASEEQETKAERLKDAFSRKRGRVARGEVLLETSENKLPWWVVYNPETGKLESPDERADTVRQIFEWAAKKMTSPEIARKLDGMGTPTWRPRADKWSPSRIRHMVLSRAAEGVLESTPRSKAAGHDFRVEGYYPVLVKPGLAERARESMTANSRYGRKGNPVPTSDRSERPVNLLRGLLRYDGNPARYDCRRNGNSGGWIGYYYGYDEASRKNLGVVSSKILEPTLLACLGELTVDMLKPKVEEVDPAVAALSHAKRRLAETETSLERILSAIERGGELDSLIKRLEALEREKANQKEQAELLERKVRSRQAVGTGEAELKELKSLLDADLGNNQMRQRVAQAVRRVVTRIDLSLEFDRGVVGLAIRTMVAGEAHMVVDPCPPRKTRKCLYMRVHFRHGGRRAIMRLPAEKLAKAGQADMLFTGRI